MTGQHMHVIAYKYPIFGQCAPDQELKKERKETKTYSTYKSWIIFLLFFRKDSFEFSIGGSKEKEMINKTPEIPAALIPYVV